MACRQISVKKSMDIYIVIHNQAEPTEGGEKEPLMGFGITDLESCWVFCLVDLSTPAGNKWWWVLSHSLSSMLKLEHRPTSNMPYVPKPREWGLNTAP